MTAPGRRRWVAPLLVLLQVAALAPYALAGLVAPARQLPWVRGVWVVLALVAVLLYRRNRLLSLAVPGVTVLIGVVVIVLGAAFFGWQG